MLKMNGPFRIDNLRRHSSATVETLRTAVVAGVTATADPHRKNFYDLEAGDSIFYIHLTRTGIVLFLACWRKEAAHQVIPCEVPLSEEVTYC